jgi:hypothetical protein
MHKISLLSKEVSDVYEFFYHLLNDRIFCGYILFHVVFLLPTFLNLTHSLIISTTDLGFASFGNLFDSVISSSYHYLLSNSVLAPILARGVFLSDFGPLV